ncbi:MAG: sigma 54-interacting transcriptional regulator [Candidatus Wallbacteria bacterium]
MAMKQIPKNKIQIANYEINKIIPIIEIIDKIKLSEDPFIAKSDGNEIKDDNFKDSMPGIEDTYVDDGEFFEELFNYKNSEIYSNESNYEIFNDYGELIKSENKEIALELYYIDQEIKIIFIKKSENLEINKIFENFSEEFKIRFSDFIKMGSDFDRFFKLKPLTQNNFSEESKIDPGIFSNIVNRYRIKINGYYYDVSDFFDSSDEGNIVLSKFAMAVILRSVWSEINHYLPDKLKNSALLDFFNSRYPDYQINARSGRNNSIRIAGEVYGLAEMNSERYDEYIINGFKRQSEIIDVRKAADISATGKNNKININSQFEATPELRKKNSLASEEVEILCESIKSKKSLKVSEPEKKEQKYAAVISSNVNNIRCFEVFQKNNFPDSMCLFKKFDGDFSDALKDHDIGFIIYDISNADNAILEKFYKIIDKKYKSMQNFPPVIFAVSEFKIKMLEEQVIDANYPKFYGLFQIDEIIDPAKNEKLVELIKNYLDNLENSENIFKIGSECKIEITSVKELNEFYRKNKFSSLFIGKNRYELLRLRNELIKLNMSKLFETMKLELGKNECYKENSQVKLLRDMEDKNFKVPEYFTRKNKIWNGFSILIKGETGTGKSLVVDWIKEFLNKMCSFKKPMDVKGLNCSNYTAELFDSAFFGCLDKSATDVSRKTGIVLNSIGNIMFLDEVGQLLPQCQAKLLIYLQNYEISPLGYSGNALYIPNFVVAATNEAIDPKNDLNDEDRKNEKNSFGNFREDLYHRFKFKLEILPLRKRREDLKILIDYVMQNPEINPLVKVEDKHKLEFLKNQDYELIADDDEYMFNYAICGILPDALGKLLGYDYPGNFRELELVLREAVSNSVYENSRIIKMRHLPEKIKKSNELLYCDSGILKLENKTGGKISALIDDDMVMKNKKKDNEILSAINKKKIKPLDSSLKINTGVRKFIEKKILKLCSGKALSKNEIAAKLGLSAKYISERILSTMRKKGIIALERMNGNPKNSVYRSLK